RTVRDRRRVDQLGVRRETRAQTAHPDRTRQLGEESLQIAHVVRDRVLQHLVARLVQADDVQVLAYARTLRQQPRCGALIQLDLDLHAGRPPRAAADDVEP